MRAIPFGPYKAAVRRVVELLDRHAVPDERISYGAEPADDDVFARRLGQLLQVAVEDALEAHFLETKKGGVEVDVAGHAALCLDERSHGILSGSGFGGPCK